VWSIGCRASAPSFLFMFALLSMISVNRGLLVLLNLLLVVRCAPSGFPSSGNGLWYSKPGRIWAKEWLPVGNGYLGGMSIYHEL